jgi:hypothetical protein
MEIGYLNTRSMEFWPEFNLGIELHMLTALQAEGFYTSV